MVFRRSLIVLSSCLLWANLFSPAGLVAGNEEVSFVTLKKNGGWCWYQDPRAVLRGNLVVFGSVAAADRDGSSPGDVEVTSWDLESGNIELFKLHPELQADDHDTPAFLILPGGRILASYMTHGNDRLMRWRITDAPFDISSWSEEFTSDVGAPLSYSNLFLLSGENNRIYNFHRGIGWNPNFMVSEDLGKSFHYGGRLLNWPRPEKETEGYSGLDGGRPYVKYASDGIAEIHFVTTEDHPRAFDNSIYHGVIRDGKVFSSGGETAGQLSGSPDGGVFIRDLGLVFKGAPDSVAWTVDLELDRQGNPFTVFSVQKDGAKWKETPGRGGLDHRYWYARWDGDSWQAREIAYAGTRLYAREDDYTGLAALHPGKPDVVYISTNSNPSTGEPLISDYDGERHWEIFRGETGGGGRTWNWMPVTCDSPVDNIRPIIPEGAEGRETVLWLRGEYRSYTDYDLDVVGIREFRSARRDR